MPMRRARNRLGPRSIARSHPANTRVMIFTNINLAGMLDVEAIENFKQLALPALVSP
jgi:hypothetical protein